MIDITIRPSETRFHENITIHLAQNAVDQRNEATQIILDFGVENSRSRNRTKSAGMVLYRCDVTAASPRLEVLDTWDFVAHSACGLTGHDGNVHYVEQPRAATAFKPINPDIDGYWTDAAQTETMGYNILPESLGALKKINASGEVEELGNVWFTDRPFNVFSTRMLSIDGDLHVCAGYGDPDSVLRYNSLASAVDNFQHIVYGRTLHYVLPNFSPNGSVYAALASLAKSINATLSFEKNIIMITDRRPYRALTNGATGTGTGNLRFSDVNKAFPSSGYLLIEKEILKYTGISGGRFTGIERGVLGSEIENHADDSEVVYLDNLIQSEKLGSPYKAITLSSDTNRIFNVIRDSGGVAEVRDADSIALYGERPYTLDLGLTRHEKAWIEEIFKSYLEELKDLQQIVNIQVVPDFSLRLGQIVPFFYKGLIRAMRIVSIRYERGATHLKGRTVAFTAPTLPDPDPTRMPDPSTPTEATTLAVVSGNNQSAEVRANLANPLVVQVNDQNGDPFQGATVSFTTTGGTLSSRSETTGSDGRASVTLTLPSTAGRVTVTASVSGIRGRITFTATATAVAPPVAEAFSAKADRPSTQQARSSAGIDFGAVPEADLNTLSRESNGYVYRLNPSIAATTLTITANFNVVFVLGSTQLDLRYAPTPSKFKQPQNPRNIFSRPDRIIRRTTNPHGDAYGSRKRHLFLGSALQQFILQ